MNRTRRAVTALAGAAFVAVFGALLVIAQPAGASSAPTGKAGLITIPTGETLRTCPPRLPGTPACH
jgi:hypothetical protein